jgi:hypothetical protein
MPKGGSLLMAGDDEKPAIVPENVDRDELLRAGIARTELARWTTKFCAGLALIFA